MASYTKQAKDESLQYLAMRARAIRAGAMDRFEYERWSASWGDGVNAARRVRSSPATPIARRLSKTLN